MSTFYSHSLEIISTLRKYEGLLVVKSVPRDNDPSALIAQLHILSSRLGNDGGDGEEAKECLRLSKALTAQLEPPENTVIDMAFSPIVAVSAQIAVDLNLFENIVQNGPVTSARLAELSGADEMLIIRILRLLSSVHFVAETAPRTWKASRITRTMATKEIAAGYRIISATAVPAMQSAPSFLATPGRGYAFPTSPKDGLAQVTFNTERTMFEYVAANPALLKDFNLYMGNNMGARRSWLEWFPVQREILDEVDLDLETEKKKVLIVDVGAGKGHDLVAFAKKFPDAGGRLVLQDLPAVTEGLDRELEVDGIEKVAYDFFTEQPIKGARVYFYHHIFHDWSDEYCLTILSRVLAAMTPGYSKLLIHDMILPEQGATQFQAQMDISMMAFNGGMERTGKQWRELLEGAGLRQIRFWDPVDDGGDGIIEAVV
ncbi:S-adenosyl-L-methionine-dependent methyltransferase [Aspergillus undulatus]|uniref:S-adenosyl-L-methionine-dependent methyltransferase n=1 Tax=Aspergillus undulatus TaxID=1810928 RepID=UPI003CCE0ACB